ncbi:hypothetical protein HDV00_008876 [Rhizophlyctis rosea]|nr:hypothetical protein HDV00_008876 [Rhizophlyctis rosea]
MAWNVSLTINTFATTVAAYALVAFVANLAIVLCSRYGLLGLSEAFGRGAITKIRAILHHATAERTFLSIALVILSSLLSPSAGQGLEDLETLKISTNATAQPLVWKPDNQTINSFALVEEDDEKLWVQKFCDVQDCKAVKYKPIKFAKQLASSGSSQGWVKDGGRNYTLNGGSLRLRYTSLDDGCPPDLGIVSCRLPALIDTNAGSVSTTFKRNFSLPTLSLIFQNEGLRKTVNETRLEGITYNNLVYGAKTYVIRAWISNETSFIVSRYSARWDKDNPYLGELDLFPDFDAVPSIRAVFGDDVVSDWLFNITRGAGGSGYPTIIKSSVVGSVIQEIRCMGVSTGGPADSNQSRDFQCFVDFVMGLSAPPLGSPSLQNDFFFKDQPTDDNPICALRGASAVAGYCDDGGHPLRNLIQVYFDRVEVYYSNTPITNPETFFEAIEDTPRALINMVSNIVAAEEGRNAYLLVQPYKNYVTWELYHVILLLVPIVLFLGISLYTLFLSAHFRNLVSETVATLSTAPRPNQSVSTSFLSPDSATVGNGVEIDTEASQRAEVARKAGDLVVIQDWEKKGAAYVGTKDGMVLAARRVRNGEDCEMQNV